MLGVLGLFDAIDVSVLYSIKILINTIKSILIIAKGCIIIMLDDVFDNLVNEIGGALADSHKEIIIERINELSETSDKVDLYDVVFDTTSDVDINSCFSEAITRNTADIKACNEIITDYGIQNAIKLWVELDCEISSENVPSERELALKILGEEYYPDSDYIFEKIVDYLTFDEDVMTAIGKPDEAKVKVKSGVEVEQFVKDINDACRQFCKENSIELRR